VLLSGSVCSKMIALIAIPPPRSLRTHEVSREHSLSGPQVFALI
jgi:hypothetical protein